MKLLPLCTQFFFHTSVARSLRLRVGPDSEPESEGLYQKATMKRYKQYIQKEHALLQLAVKLRCWITHKGLYLQKKNCVYQALSLSLSSTGRESERRGWGELDPGQVQPPSCHFQPMHSVPPLTCKYWGPGLLTGILRSLGDVGFPPVHTTGENHQNLGTCSLDRADYPQSSQPTDIHTIFGHIYT